jgi:nitroreductase
MELVQTIENRMSIRSYTSETVSREILREIVRRAGHAPSINNSQPWKFLVITRKDLLRKMAESVSESINELPVKDAEDLNKSVLSRVEWYSTFFEEAPVLIAMLMKPYESVLEQGTGITHDEITKMRNHPDMQTAGAAIQNILLSAVDFGLGACWMSAPLVAQAKLEALLEIKEPWKLITFVAMGHPFGKPARKSRKSVDEIIQFVE